MSSATPLELHRLSVRVTTRPLAVILNPTHVATAAARARTRLYSEVFWLTPPWSSRSAVQRELVHRTIIVITHDFNLDEVS